MSKYDDYTIELAVLLLRKMADKMEEDADFAYQVLDEAKALRQSRAKQVKQLKNSSGDISSLPSESAAKKPVAKAKRSEVKVNKESSIGELPDIYAIYMEGKEEGLRNCLEGYEPQILAGIVSKNHLDPSGKVRRWKSKLRIIDFIVETTKKRLSQGDAFRSE